MTSATTDAADDGSGQLLADASTLLDTLHDPQLSLEAKGIYCVLRAFQGQSRLFSVTVPRLREVCREGPSTLTRALDELVEHGLVQRVSAGARYIDRDSAFTYDPTLDGPSYRVRDRR